MYTADRQPAFRQLMKTIKSKNSKSQAPNYK